jgi:hypothetical protein
LSEIEGTVRQIVAASSWDERVQAIRHIPEIHGKRQHKEVYAAVAKALYQPLLSPQIAFVPWREEYGLGVFEAAYEKAFRLTAGFEEVAPEALARTLQQAPDSLQVFRTIIGYSTAELAVAVAEVAEDLGVSPISSQRLKGFEGGGRCSPEDAVSCAETIHRLMTRGLWGEAPEGYRSKLDKLDTLRSWESVRKLARSGVPYSAFLHQRHVGGAFRQLLDATSSKRGDLLERPVEELFKAAGIPHLRTQASNQNEISKRFNLTVRPAPDFVVFEEPNHLRAILECKQTNDGGTARDKAARYEKLRGEAMRLGGIALFAVLDGLGWSRLNDALGPVVRDCDGRVFTLKTLPEMLDVRPLASLRQDC